MLVELLLLLFMFMFKFMLFEVAAMVLVVSPVPILVPIFDTLDGELIVASSFNDRTGSLGLGWGSLRGQYDLISA